jgi:CubicO group peptidase (beta-lactamase class C family)
MAACSWTASVRPSARSACRSRLGTGLAGDRCCATTAALAMAGRLPGIRELLEDVRLNPGPERWREETNAWDWCPRQFGYRSQFWLTAPRTGRPAIPHAAGAFGQKCYIDKEQRTVLVKFSSYWDTLPDKLHLQEPPIFDLIAIESFLEQVPKLVA